jgi:glycosyltransferase involved in cell wall biosynthesis
MEPSVISICAVIGVRNEAHYLRVLLPLLAAQKIDVFIVDHASTDGSHSLYAELAGQPIIGVEDLPYHGYFSLSDQLAAKREIYRKLPHDWVIHQDADEILEHAAPGLTLRHAIEEAAGCSFSALNFDEFVFLPEPGADYRGRHYDQELRRYYHFAPHPNRLNRAWRRDLGLDHGQSGGHVLAGDGLWLSPANHVLRHYIVLGEEHARQKYLHRSFSREDRDRGWHGNRIDFTEAGLALPEESPFLFELDRGDSKAFRRDRPAAAHYWQWRRHGEPAAPS